MGIFTFMGGAVLQMDDAYSFQVIDRAIESVVPAVLQVGRGRFWGGRGVLVASEVVFLLILF